MKKNRKHYIAIVFLSFLCIHIFANDSTKLIKYSPDFKFTDGIFLDFEQVKKNNPVKKAQILTTIDYKDNGFFDQLLKKNTFSFYDQFGQKFDFPIKNVWGYADNGMLYKNINNEFYRITIVGTICHFVAYVTTYDYSPSPYYSPYDRYGYSNYRSGNRNENTNLKQYIIDFNSGKVLEYTTSNLEALFIKDSEIYDEYASLSKKKKNKLKFVYIRKFNEQNPLYFPDNKLIP